MTGAVTGRPAPAAAGDGGPEKAPPGAPPGVRPGVRIGVDLGSVRVGVASSDPAGTLASPRTTLPREPAGRELAGLVALAAELDCVEIFVGLPRSLSGRPGPAEAAARGWAARLAAAAAPRPVRLVDERWSTVAATAGLAAAGVRGRAARRRVDAAAAAVILQAALDGERSTGRPAGELVRPGPGGLPPDRPGSGVPRDRPGGAGE